jgi:hypothetical protein
MSFTRGEGRYRGPFLGGKRRDVVNEYPIRYSFMQPLGARSDSSIDVLEGKERCLTISDLRLARAPGGGELTFPATVPCL